MEWILGHFYPHSHQGFMGCQFDYCRQYSRVCQCRVLRLQLSKRTDWGCVVSHCACQPARRRGLERFHPRNRHHVQSGIQLVFWCRWRPRKRSRWICRDCLAWNRARFGVQWFCQGCGPRFCRPRGRHSRQRWRPFYMQQHSKEIRPRSPNWWCSCRWCSPLAIGRSWCPLRCIPKRQFVLVWSCSNLFQWWRACQTLRTRPLGTWQQLFTFWQKCICSYGSRFIRWVIVQNLCLRPWRVGRHGMEHHVWQTVARS